MSLSSLSIRRPVTTPPKRWQAWLMFYVGIVLPRQKDGGQVGIIAIQNLAVGFLPPIKIPRLTVWNSRC